MKAWNFSVVILISYSIVFVPGLGAHPEDSWKSESTGFNWTTDGLVRDFPRARILLYMYESAWTGSLKVKQFMSNIAMTLLNGLKSKREVGDFSKTWLTCKIC